MDERSQSSSDFESGLNENDFQKFMDESLSSDSKSDQQKKSKPTVVDRISSMGIKQHEKSELSWLKGHPSSTNTPTMNVNRDPQETALSYNKPKEVSNSSSVKDEHSDMDEVIESEEASEKISDPIYSIIMDASEILELASGQTKVHNSDTNYSESFEESVGAEQEQSKTESPSKDSTSDQTISNQNSLENIENMNLKSVELMSENSAPQEEPNNEISEIDPISIANFEEDIKQHSDHVPSFPIRKRKVSFENFLHEDESKMDDKLDAVDYEKKEKEELPLAEPGQQNATITLKEQPRAEIYPVIPDLGVVTSSDSSIHIKANTEKSKLNSTIIPTESKNKVQVINESPGRIKQIASKPIAGRSSFKIMGRVQKALIETKPKKIYNAESNLRNQVIRLKKDVESQDRLLKGYENENEKLYNEVKVLKKEFMENKTKLTQQREKHTFEVSKLRETIRLLEFGKNAPVNQGTNHTLQLHENKMLKLELEEFSNQIETTRKSEKATLLKAEEEMKILKIRLNKTESLSAELAAKLKESSSREDMIKNELASLKAKLASSETLNLLEQQLISTFKELDENQKDSTESLHSLTEHFQALKQAYAHMEAKRARDYHTDSLKAIDSNSATDRSDLARPFLDQASQCNLMDSKFEEFTLQNEDLRQKLGTLSQSYQELEDKVLSNQLTATLNTIRGAVESLNHAKDGGDPEVDDLRCKNQTQEIIIVRLKDKLKQFETENENLKMENQKLSEQNKKKKPQDIAFKTCNSLELLHIQDLEKKLDMLEQRYSKREKQLRSIQKKLFEPDIGQFHDEVSYWQNQVLLRNKQLEEYRKEMGSIVNVLNTLGLDKQ